MRALVVSSTAAECIELRDVSEPSPAPDETLVQVHAVSINRGEVNRVLLAPRPRQGSAYREIDYREELRPALDILKSVSVMYFPLAICR
jgi:hypothetical protein